MTDRVRADLEVPDVPEQVEPQAKLSAEREALRARALEAQELLKAKRPRKVLPQAKLAKSRRGWRVNDRGDWERG